MKRNEIWLERRRLKKAAHGAVRAHYFLLVFLSLLLIFFGTEFQIARITWGKLYQRPEISSHMKKTISYASKSPLSSPSGELLEKLSREESLQDLPKVSPLKVSLVETLLERRIIRLSALEENVRARTEEAVLRANKGVFASLANDLYSGRFLFLLTERIYDIVASRTGTAIILSSLLLLVHLFIYIFFRCFYSAALRRVVLEGRIYPKTSFPTLFFMFKKGRWTRVSVTLFVKEILYTLWGLTLVGLVVKRYSYMAAAYIAAENPNLTPLQTITLSRRMMEGHKMEMFLYELTLLPWRLLGILTFGLSDMLYGVSYLISCEAEFYVRVREDAIQRGVEGTQALKDTYLFEKADKILLYETYFDVVDELTLLHEEKMELPPVRKRLCENYGIWLGSASEKHRYDDLQGRAYLLKGCRESMEGEAYPRRLLEGCQNQEIPKQGSFFFLRSYAPYTLLLLFLLFSIIGWCWEVGLHFWQTGQLVNRGTMHGPWLPIYGTGGCVVMVLCNRFRKKPVAEFFVAMGLCGVIEYLTSWYLERIYHRLWWSYEGYFLNLNGRICAEGLLVFGLACIIVVYSVAPLFDYQVNRMSHQRLSIICLCLTLVFSADWIYSLFCPNMSEGAAVSREAINTQSVEAAPLKEEEAKGEPDFVRDCEAGEVTNTALEPY